MACDVSPVAMFYFPQHIIVNVFLSYDNDGANAWLRCKQHQHGIECFNEGQSKHLKERNKSNMLKHIWFERLNA